MPSMLSDETGQEVKDLAKLSLRICGGMLEDLCMIWVTHSAGRFESGKYQSFSITFHYNLGASFLFDSDPWFTMLPKLWLAINRNYCS